MMPTYSMSVTRVISVQGHGPEGIQWTAEFLVIAKSY